MKNKTLLLVIFGITLLTLMLQGVHSALFQSSFVFNHNQLSSNQKYFLQENHIKHFRNYGKYDIYSNKFLGLFRGTKAQTYTLLDSENSIINAWAILEVKNYQNAKLLSGLEFKGGIPKGINVFYWVNKSYIENVPDYKKVCGVSINGTKFCKSEKYGNHVETKYKAYWKKYNNEVLPAGTYKIKITGKLPAVNHKIDWILKSGEGNYPLENWLWWNTSWAYRREISNLTGDISYLNITYDTHMNADFSDIRFVDNATESTELNYTIENKTNSAWAIVRVNNLGASAIQMYYGNSGATTTSSTSDTYYNPKYLYYFDEQDTTGTGVIIDSMKIANGTNNGATNTTGKIGTAYHFDGSSTKINTTANILGAENGTLSVWFKSDNFSSSVVESLIDTSTTDHSSNIGTYHNDTGNYLNIGHQAGSNDWVITNSSLSIDTWYFFTFAWNTTGRYVYLNNNLVGSKSNLSWDSIGTNVSFGARRYDGTNYDQFFNGTIDEIYIYNKALTKNEVSALYNQTAPNYVLGIERQPLKITLNSPVDTYNSTLNTITFNGTVSSTGTLYNVSLILDGTYNETNTSGVNGNYIFTKALLDGDHNWTYEACDSEIGCINATTRTLTIDTKPPTISVVSPNETYGYIYENYPLWLNFTATDAHLDSCWYNYNGTNTSISCSSGVLSTSTFNYQKGDNSLIVYANDTSGHLTSASTSWNYKIFRNSKTMNSTSFTTQRESYIINLTSDSKLTKVYLNYSGHPYLATHAGDLWTYSFDIPEYNEGNNSVNWIMTYNGVNYSSFYDYQNVTKLVFTLCNSTYPTEFIKFTYKNETLNEEPINGTIDSSWIYYLGRGTQTQTLNYINTTESPEFDFCSNAGGLKIHAQGTVSYSNSESPQRTRYIDTFLTNSTTSIVLYLLPISLGLYSPFQTIKSTGDPVPDVTGTITRVIGGSTIIVTAARTDDSGFVTFFLNPDITYIGTFSKVGYSTVTFSFVPSTNTRTITMGTVSTIGNGTQIGTGTSYTITPKNSTLLNNTNYTFGFNATSSNETITFISMNITDEKGNSYLYKNYSGGGYISGILNTSDNKTLIGYYILKTSTETFSITKKWNVGTNFEGEYSLFKQLSLVMDYGWKNFIRIFLVLIIIISISLYLSKLQMQDSQEIIIGVITLLIWAFSLVGWLNTGIIVSSSNTALQSLGELSNQYGIAILTTGVAVYFILRRIFR